MRSNYQINRAYGPLEAQTQVEEGLSGDQCLLVSWKEECEAQDDAISSVPILWIAVRREISIPEYEMMYILGENSVPRHTSVDILGKDDVSVLIVIVGVFVGILNFVWIMRHVWINVLTKYRFKIWFKYYLNVPQVRLKDHHLHPRRPPPADLVRRLGHQQNRISHWYHPQHLGIVTK